ncbi:MAG: hypothetical protein WEE50_10065 [Chloroflexota bacterium]
MINPTGSRRAFLPIAGLMTLLLVAAPVLAAKPDKGPELARTLTGTVASSEDGKGRAIFTMTVGGVAWELSAGPRWFWGANNPLAPFVGKSVEVAGTYHAGENNLDVDTVDGKALRAPGRPAWAGGPKVVGKGHPGWKDGNPGNGLGRANAPGQLKDKTTPPSAD